MIGDGTIQALFWFYLYIYCFMFKSIEDTYRQNTIDQNTLSLLANLNLSLGMIFTVFKNYG